MYVALPKIIRQPNCGRLVDYVESAEFSATFWLIVTALMVIGPWLDELVEFLELGFGAGFRCAAFEPPDHVNFEVAERRVWMPGMDASHRLFDRQPSVVQTILRCLGSW